MANPRSTIDRHDLPPYPVVQFVELCIARLDGCLLAAMHLAVIANEIPDMRTGHTCNTAVGLWMKWWWQWGGRSVTKSVW